MTFDLRKSDYSREHIFIVEIDLDYCTRTYGTSPCLASVGVTGDQRCFNTQKTCQYPSAYNKTIKTYRFCSDVSPIPAALDAIPSIQSVNMSPSVIDLSGGLGVRASVSISFADHPSSDIGIDPYLSTRSYIASDVGTFWGRLRSRNPYYLGRALRVGSGYLVNGQFDPANFQVRYYVIERIDVANGSATIVAKDPLKLADSERAQMPRPSSGQIATELLPTQTTVDLVPAGVGAEYSASGYVRIRSEVMAYTRSGDTLTLTRGQFNTQAADHKANDTVQECKYYNALPVQSIISDLLINGADVDSSFIPIADWNAEADEYLPGLLTAIITKPVGVQTLLKELGEQAPHVLYWDEREQEIKFKAIKPPPDSAPVLNDDDNIVEIGTKDEQEMRESTIVVHFGQVDPTRRLDEVDNYQQTYVRTDGDSVEAYGSNKIKTIFSRWITSVNKAAAVLLASRRGRRWSEVPRSVEFELDSKDSDLWAGDTVEIRSRNIPDFTGAPGEQLFQITSVKESRDRYRYTGIEYNYSEAGIVDPGTGDRNIIIGADINDVNIRLLHDTLFPPPDDSTVVNFTIESGVTVGSTSPFSPALRTGSWPSGATVNIINNGTICGAGGNGGDGLISDGLQGGDGIWLDHPITYDSTGILAGGGGGGGGGYGLYLFENFDISARGGGGAGVVVGQGANPGTATTGGAGETVSQGGYSATGGDGGDLAQPGASGSGDTSSGAGGAAGYAARLFGYSVTVISAGTIIGTEG